MYLGRMVETAPAAVLFATPAHPYTKMLLASVPQQDGLRSRQPRAAPRGEPPSPLSPPPGCHFHPRCPEAIARCRIDDPVLRSVGRGHAAACHLVGAETPHLDSTSMGFGAAG